MSTGTNYRSDLNWEAFGEYLADRRKERQLTQSELASAIGTAQPNVSQYERGVAEPTIETLCRIASVLKVNVDNFLRQLQEK